LPQFPSPTPSHNVNEVGLSTVLQQLAIIRYRGAQQEFCFNKGLKEIVPFQQARVSIPILGVKK